jgi:hypothetical protein
MRKFNMKKARVLYRKGIHNFEPRTPYQTSGMFRQFTPEELESIKDLSRGRQFYNAGIKNEIDLGRKADMSKFYINPEQNYINTTSTGIPNTVDGNLKRINQMYLSNNRQMPELNATDKRNILDEMNKRSFDYQSSDEKLIDKYFKSIKRNSGYMMAQLGAQVPPTDSIPSNSRMDPFKINQTEQPKSYLNNDMYNRGYNINYDMQGKPMEPTTPFEDDPFNPNWIEYNQALKDYYKTLENDPNNYSHMKKGLRPKRPMRGYGGDLNYMKYGR